MPVHSPSPAWGSCPRPEAVHWTGRQSTGSSHSPQLRKHQFLRREQHKHPLRLFVMVLCPACEQTVSDAFKGEECSTVTASTTKNELSELSLNIPLNIPPGRACTLEDCFNMLHDVENISDYRCQECKAETPATKRLSVSEYPDVLVVHLKRFTSDKRGYGNDVDLGKNATPVSVPEYLDAPTLRATLGQCDDGTRYQLVSTVVHHGLGLGCGHYTSFARLTPLDDQHTALSKSKPSGSQQALWASYDDSQVSICRVGKAKFNRAGVRAARDIAACASYPSVAHTSDIVGRDSYMLFYQKLHN